MSHSQFHSIELFILTHAWLNLWDKRMTTGRINQVTRYLKYSFIKPKRFRCKAIRSGWVDHEWHFKHTYINNSQRRLGLGAQTTSLCLNLLTTTTLKVNQDKSLNTHQGIIEVASKGCEMLFIHPPKTTNQEVKTSMPKETQHHLTTFSSNITTKKHPVKATREQPNKALCLYKVNTLKCLEVWNQPNMMY